MSKRVYEENCNDSLVKELITNNEILTKKLAQYENSEVSGFFSVSKNLQYFNNYNKLQRGTRTQMPLPNGVEHSVFKTALESALTNINNLHLPVLDISTIDQNYDTLGSIVNASRNVLEAGLSIYTKEQLGVFVLDSFKLISDIKYMTALLLAEERLKNEEAITQLIDKLISANTTCDELRRQLAKEKQKVKKLNFDSGTIVSESDDSDSMEESDGVGAKSIYNKKNKTRGNGMPIQKKRYLQW